MHFLSKETFQWAAAVLLACTFAISCKKDNPTPVAAPDTYEVVF